MSPGNWRGNVVAFRWQKGGSPAEEYEDAFTVNDAGMDDGEREGERDGQGNVENWDLANHPNTLRIAVADGATESMLSGSWARTLVKEFTDSEDDMRSCLDRALDSWPGWLQRYKTKREEDEKPIAWYEEPGLARGAHATLLVAEFVLDPNSLPNRQSGTWTAVAIGDSCLFQVSDERLNCAFPLITSVDFNTSPALVHTAVEDRTLLDKHSRTRSGTWTSGDIFFLCTDALAEWFLSTSENDSRPWETWRDFSSGPQDFYEWVQVERQAGRLKNDDVTLLNVQFE